jgi:uroporphyrin-3 C-methyltransferase
VIVAVLALGLSAWQWVETRLRLGDTQQEVARRLADAASAGKENQLAQRQTQDQLMALQSRFGALESRLQESQSQQAALENLYQDLARNRDEWALAEIEQSVTLASQQLQMAGNVQGAVLALQAADARLAGSSRPQFIGVRKALARDLDRLRALPQTDLPGMSARLESVVVAIDTLPLAVDARPRAESEAPPETATVADSAWRQLAADVWREIRSLVRIQRFDRDEPVLLAPGQAFFLRENLKLRLLNARLALLAREQWTFRNELKHAQAWLDRYFDSREPSLHTVQGALKQLASTDISIEVPTLNESLAAIKTFKLGKEQPR